MNHLENTFCNPIVLPDYPLLSAKSHGMIRFDRGPGDRAFVTESDLIREKYPEKAAFSFGGGLEPPVANDEDGFFPPPGAKVFGRIAENDVRATADPTVLLHEGRWYLYCTSGMVYHSEDFHTWIPHPGDDVWMSIAAPMAPTVEAFRGRFYATANSVPVHVSDSPIGPWSLLGEWTLPDGREMLANDPMIFQDDDHLYLYWGLGSGIFGAELDPERPNHLISEPKLLIAFNPEHWWERFGASNEDWRSGCMEGSWMVRRNGLYYLVYSVCGTEYASYCMGAYVCNSPLGEFVPQPSNPVSRSRAGLIQGGGHGCIVEGPGRSLWCFYTIPVSIDHIFERRIGMDPVGVAEDGSLFARTGCTVPQFIPGAHADPQNGNDAGLVPVSVCKPTWASSCAPGHIPLYAIDETLHTWWQPDIGDEVPTFAVSFFGKFNISAIRLMWKDVGLDYGQGIFPGPYRYVVESCPTLWGEHWTTLVDASKNDVDLSVDYRTFETILSAKVRIRILGTVPGVTPGILNFTVFGVSSAKPQ